MDRVNQSKPDIINNHVSIRTSNTIIKKIIQLLNIIYINKNLKNSIKGMCTSGWDQNWRRNDEMEVIMLSIFLINKSHPWVWEVKWGSWAGSRVSPGSALGFQSFQASYVHTYYVLHKTLKNCKTKSRQDGLGSF